MPVDFHPLHVLVHQALHRLLVQTGACSLWRTDNYHLPKLIWLPFNRTLSMKNFDSTRAHFACLLYHLKLTLALAKPLLVSDLAPSLSNLLAPAYQLLSVTLSSWNQNIIRGRASPRGNMLDVSGRVCCCNRWFEGKSVSLHYF